MAPRICGNRESPLAMRCCYCPAELSQVALKSLLTNRVPSLRSGLKKLSYFPLFHFFYFLLDVLDFSAVFADIEAQVSVNAHVLVCDPNQREKRDQVAAPVVEEQLVMREDKKKRRDIMTKAEFAGEEEKELAACRVGMALTLADAIIARLTEDFFMRHGPGDAGNGQGKRKKPYELQRERHS